jgi:transcription antitermination factor NusG
MSEGDELNSASPFTNPGTDFVPEKTWYAVYTKPRFEKKALEGLTETGIESFLPLIKTLKQWSDRKKWVEEPLFRSYLFVHIVKPDYYRVLNTAGVVKYITFEGKAVPVPPQQITAIRQYINAEEFIPENHFNPEIGDKVEISRGELQGLTGNLVKIQGRQKVRIEIESIGHSITLTIPKSFLRKIKTMKNMQ